MRLEHLLSGEDAYLRLVAVKSADVGTIVSEGLKEEDQGLYPSLLVFTSLSLE